MAKTIFLDARCMGRGQVHDYLARRLPMPEYYGRNLDALHDCLTELPELTLIVEHTAAAPPYFGRIRRVLRDAARENPALSVAFCEQGVPGSDSAP